MAKNKNKETEPFTSQFKRTSQTKSSPVISENRQKLYDLFNNRPIGVEDTLTNITLYLRSGVLSKILFVNEIYEEFKNIPGQIFEFGCWLGATTTLFENLRAVHEPYNHLRKIYAFDSFGGYFEKYREPNESDEFKEIISDQVYGCPENYPNYLRKVLEFHSKNNVMGHDTKYEIIEGDVIETLPEFLLKHQEAIVACAFLDVAMYQPTSEILMNLIPRLIPGSILVLDELGHPSYSGETKAFFEAFKGIDYSICRSRFLSDRCYIRIN